VFQSLHALVKSNVHSLIPAILDFHSTPLPPPTVAKPASIALCLCQRPYHVECTGSRQITEVKQRWAWIVLGWETAWEHQVLLAFVFLRDRKD
jgi:hypothetical protein